jgi:60 kDa SS-A/Ro ribonucleoprotein
MARRNMLHLNFGPRTHEGAPVRNISTELQLRRSVMACLLWESQFYEDGVEIAGRIAELVPQVAAEKIAALAIEGRERMKLRHAPLLLVREMARHKTHRALVSETLAQVIQRVCRWARSLARTNLNLCHFRHRHPPPIPEYRPIPWSNSPASVLLVK